MRSRTRLIGLIALASALLGGITLGTVAQDRIPSQQVQVLDPDDPLQDFPLMKQWLPPGISPGLGGNGDVCIATADSPRPYADVFKFYADKIGLKSYDLAQETSFGTNRNWFGGGSGVQYASTQIGPNTHGAIFVAQTAHYNFTIHLYQNREEPMVHIMASYIRR